MFTEPAQEDPLELTGLELSLADPSSPLSYMTPLSFSLDINPHHPKTVQLINEFLTSTEAPVLGKA